MVDWKQTSTIATGVTLSEILSLMTAVRSGVSVLTLQSITKINSMQLASSFFTSIPISSRLVWANGTGKEWNGEVTSWTTHWWPQNIHNRRRSRVQGGGWPFLPNHIDLWRGPFRFVINPSWGNIILSRELTNICDWLPVSLNSHCLTLSPSISQMPFSTTQETCPEKIGQQLAGHSQHCNSRRRTKVPHLASYPLSFYYFKSSLQPCFP